MNHPKNGTWLTEYFTPEEKHSHLLKQYIVRKKTKFQNVILADSASFKRCLVLDGEMQSAEYDERIYHESLVHPAMMSCPAPRKILIMGGGEGATARELLRYKSVEKIVMVDIDGEVVEFCKKYLGKWHCGAFSDKRVELVIDDAKKYVETTEEKFDIIISDLPTPIEGGPAYALYTSEFYRTLKKKLARGGILAVQAGSGNLLQFNFHKMLFATLRSVFNDARAYYSYVPSFDVPWAFIVASDSKRRVSASAVDAKIKKLDSRKAGRLKFYDGLTHEGLFAIPKFYRDILSSEKRIISSHRPVFFFK
ncbi:MAG: polyamine aminopropyltransferase [Elusimicrobia bacterium HGW-Elusimicrobia-1]|jgi:spermidine synthase|nr:MAG: polyamine aminopropyltransferase [Elusimicrobia bacterium HGW-Elusimicrobia-1]